MQVRKELGESGLSLAGLELEITVGVLIEDVAREEDDAIAQEPQHPDRAGRLRDRVFLVVLNRGLPLDRIKIYRAFVASVGQNERSLAIVRAVIGLAQGVGVPVLAEGIETKVQMSLLVQEGCDEIQGYLIGRPQRLAAESRSKPRVLFLVQSAS